MQEQNNSFSWNIMFNYIIKIKHRYIQTFPDDVIEDISFQEMCSRLGEEQFLADTIIRESARDFGRLVLVKYYLLSSGMDDLYRNPQSIYREGRSLVVNLTKEEIVLCPFKKFFNIDEIPETSMEIVADQIKHAKLVEFSDKLDGSFQQFRYYNGTIVYSGSSALETDMSFQLDQGTKIFFSNDNYKKMVSSFPDYTFIFEAILTEDRHVVKYHDDSLRLVGMRNVYTGKELNYRQVVDIAKKYDIQSTVIDDINMEEAIKLESSLKSSEKEGWVINIVTEDNQYRYKFKCSDYVKIHAILYSLSSDNIIIEALANETFDDILSKVPSYFKDRLNERANYIRAYVRVKNQIIDGWYDKLKHIENRKEFANEVNSNVPKEFRQFMFSKKDGKSYNLLILIIYSQQPRYIKMHQIDEFMEKYANDLYIERMNRLHADQLKEEQ